jgi:hypothetical protein
MLSATNESYAKMAITYSKWPLLDVKIISSKRQLMLVFSKVFRGGQDFFDPQIVMSTANGNFGVKIVKAPL